jgi:DNA replication and repair protein RecF
MHLATIHIDCFRNISQLDLDFTPGFNLICGENGSGKTSLIEAIYYLGTGRSFRSHLVSRVVQRGASKFLLGGKLEQDGQDLAIGIERSLEGLAQAKIAGEKINSATELARLVPMQLITQQSFNLLIGGPKYRRKFIDWGLFHVEQNFLDHWQKANLILKQRNAALKSHHLKTAIDGWDISLNEVSTTIHNWRCEYTQKIFTILAKMLPFLLGDYEISCKYYAGWDTQHDLYTILQKSFPRDQQLGYSQFGPHRAELRLLINNIPVQDVLSRGQQKILIIALGLAQGILLQELSQKPCIYLIDDMAAELDEKSLALTTDILCSLKAQTFLTALNKDVYTKISSSFPCKMFHVKQGEVVFNAPELLFLN